MKGVGLLIPYSFQDPFVVVGVGVGTAGIMTVDIVTLFLVGVSWFCSSSQVVPHRILSILSLSEQRANVRRENQVDWRSVKNKLKFMVQS